MDFRRSLPSLLWFVGERLQNRWVVSQVVNMLLPFYVNRIEVHDGSFCMYLESYA